MIKKIEQNESPQAGCAPATGSANAVLCAENARLRAALEDWVKYFQTDVPMTAEAAEAQGEEFTRCWFETQKALSPND